ncbi:MAG: tyrosine-type recombinase/integrase, partial [Alphaproteobacteria bacterium]|nr:tyrosine-type recombinase/integrase [Alphaproteobacteria bacterium]
RARKIAADWLLEVRNGGDPGGERLTERKSQTFAEFAERYMNDHAVGRKKPSTIATDRTNLKHHLLPALGRLKVGEISRADVVRLHQSMQAKPGAANRSLELLSHMMTVAEMWGLRPDNSNPCRRVKKYRLKKHERFLSEAELGRLAAVLNEVERARTEMPSVIATIRLLLFTGARLGEIRTLRWDYVDMEGQCLRLPDSKTGPKTVYLPPAALEVLSELERQTDNPFVIVGAKPGTCLVNIQRPWRRIRKQAGLDDVRIHDLRHSFASMCRGAEVVSPTSSQSRSASVLKCQ